jgi:hypothetical protein
MKTFSKNNFFLQVDTKIYYTSIVDKNKCSDTRSVNTEGDRQGRHLSAVKNTK